MATKKHSAPEEARASKKLPSADVLARKARRASDRMMAAIKALNEHPESIAREAARKKAEELAKSEPTLVNVLNDVTCKLHGCEDVVLTVVAALEQGDSTDARAAAMTLRVGCMDELTEQIELLEHALTHARIRGSTMVVAIDEEERQ